ncbi:hypothetical protein YTPLAS18_17470 [Nitrospira sp.]|nr:hypothetical protein YTPLAS18_17470 [Nitrospira sp.]
MNTALRIPQSVLDELVAHAREQAPHECCGFLAGVKGTVTRLYRIGNVVALEGATEHASFDDAKMTHLGRLSPEERAEIAFVMDSHDMFKAVKDMRAHGLELQVVYHSHPHDPARPSVTDIKIASEWEENWPKLHLLLPYYLLVSLQNPTQPDIKLYEIKGTSVTPLAFSIDSSIEPELRPK